jgi:hypothetical protein
MFRRFHNLVPSLWAKTLFKHAKKVIGDEAIPDGDQPQYREVADLIKGIAELKAAIPGYNNY